MALPLVGLGISVGGSLLSGLFGLSQKAKARRLERNNVRPNYQVSPYVRQNLALAEQRSRTGLPQEVYNNQLNQMQTGLSTGLRSLGSRGINPYNVAGVLSGFNRGLGNLNAMDAQARTQNEQLASRARLQMAEEERQAFNINQLNPYLQTRQEIANLRSSGTQNIFGGLGMLAQAGMMYGSSGQRGVQTI